MSKKEPNFSCQRVGLVSKGSGEGLTNPSDVSSFRLVGKTNPFTLATF